MGKACPGIYLERPVKAGGKETDLQLPGITLLRFLRTVFGARFFSVLDRCAVERAANNVVANAGKVFDPAAANEYDTVFLKVMSFAWNVGDDLLAVRKTDPSDLSQG